ncbi:MAG: flavodoxin family protein [Thermodesulfobacteriota bacterium]
MEILVILGSPRKLGNSETLALAAIEGMEAAGAGVETVRLAKLWIQPCIHCGGCDQTGECVLDDDMDCLYEKLWTLPRIVVASPIFFYGVTAHTKAFVDRTQALWSRKRLLQERGEWHRDPARLGYFISVGATRGARLFDGAVMTMRYAFDAMGMGYGGDLLVRGADKRGDLEGRAEELAAARELGRRIVAGTKTP